MFPLLREHMKHLSKLAHNSIKNNIYMSQILDCGNKNLETFNRYI